MPLFVRQASTPLLALIAAGGVLYTLGAWFYARQGFRYHHMVWHLLINLAVAAHFTGIVFFCTECGFYGKTPRNLSFGRFNAGSESFTLWVRMPNPGGRRRSLGRRLRLDLGDFGRSIY